MCLSRTASEQRLAEQAKAKIQTPMVPKTPLQAEVPREEPKRRPIPPPPKADLVEILSAEPEPEEVSVDSLSSRLGRPSLATALPDPSLITIEPQSSASISGGSSSPKVGASSPLLIGDFLATGSALPAQVDDTARLQWREFGLIYVAYMGFLLSRKNYGFWLRSVISELGHDKGNAGLLGSTLEVTYGTCSFLNGVVLDSRSPKQMLVAGLVLSAALNLSVASTDSLPLMIFLWGLNGAVQSVGWPSVTSIFLAWFPDPSSRGAWYSLLSTCQNAGAALVPLLVSASVSSYGWRAPLYAPAVASTGVALLLGALLYGSPDAVASHRDGGMSTPHTKAKAKPADLAHTMREQVFMNPKLWLMAISYFGCSMVRTCLQDWTSLYLMESKSMQIATAARCLFLWELGGFGGTFIAGAISDKVFNGRRGPVVCICCALLAPTLLLLLHTSSPTVAQLCYLWLGVCAFPVHVLLGLFSREVVPPSVSTTAGGFVKMIAQIGGASAGYPLGMLQQKYGWEGVFGFLAAVSLGAATAAAPLWTATAQVRIQARNGTVQDFKTMAPRSNSDKDLFKRFDKNRSLANMAENKKDK